MEIIYLLFGATMLVFAILQIILFFKLWGMTNDIKEIRDLISRSIPAQETKQITDIPICDPNDPWQIGGRVVRLATDEQYIIVSLNADGTVYAKKNNLIADTFRRDELMLWDEYLAKIKK